MQDQERCRCSEVVIFELADATFVSADCVAGAPAAESDQLSWRSAALQANRMYSSSHWHSECPSVAIWLSALTCLSKPTRLVDSSAVKYALAHLCSNSLWVWTSEFGVSTFWRNELADVRKMQPGHLTFLAFRAVSSTRTEAQLLGHVKYLPACARRISLVS